MARQLVIQRSSYRLLVSFSNISALHSAVFLPLSAVFQPLPAVLSIIHVAPPIHPAIFEPLPVATRAIVLPDRLRPGPGLPGPARPGPGPGPARPDLFFCCRIAAGLAPARLGPARLPARLGSARPGSARPTALYNTKYMYYYLILQYYIILYL